MPRDTNNGALFDDVHHDLRYDTSRRVQTWTSASTIRIIDGHTYDLVGRYTAPKTIGSGAFGHVISAWDNLLQRKVAIKKIRLPAINTEEAMSFYSRSLREICILPPLKHDNIVQVLDCYTTALCPEQMTEIYLVTNLMHMDLHELIKENKARTLEMRFLSAGHIKLFLYQILRALKFIHSAKVMHRDLKPSNIFIDLDGHLRIGDFGLARVPEENMETPMTSYVCTRWYRAPELMLLNGLYTASMDMWSVGCILAELIYGQPLYPGRHHLDQLRLIVEHRCGSLGFSYHQHQQAFPTISDRSLNLLRRTLSKCPNEYPHVFSVTDSNVIVSGVDKSAFDLLEKLLRINPSERLTAEEALHSCLFDNYRKEASGEPSSEEAFQLDLSPYNLHEIRSMLYQKVRLTHQQMQEKTLFLYQKKMAMEHMDCC